MRRETLTRGEKARTIVEQVSETPARKSGFGAD